ncbi:FAD-dependent oxidoreductase [Allonocardiopsis opalescens]|uniref:ferredoxin--NADP(+) reductase n=1 Tax=Allonocardiopsis opalescens TaxID=1144618 RepID=A0A2T0PU22_9ACTN|nr:FAD-dependent oxidoreductase [Allonocardiopsis opalescens]PRX92394.1 ferredoxin--NADP+ reductase [Allonocardiopsis opalescens]
MTSEAVLRVAIIGSGPAGIYAADALSKQGGDGVLVDVFDRLPTPYGLVRYGVAPDHLNIKSIARTLDGVLERPGVRFIGGIEYGRDLSRADLRRAYDAVVFATGATVDRRLGIPGEDLPGSVAATEFVNWYSGHPDVEVGRFVLDAERAVVIGVGNVAVDVVRILAKTADELRHTDIPQPVLDTLAGSKVRRIHLIGRRGPAHAKFTPKELRELGKLDHAGVSVRPDEIDFDPNGPELLTASRSARTNLKVLDEWAHREPADAERRIDIRFWLRPVAILGEDRVEAVRVERTELDADGRLVGTGEVEEIPADLVLRSVGYRSLALPGVPFDEASATVPHTTGRVLSPEGEPVPGDYVAGWAKRGPTGVVGTNRSDAAETARCVLADAAELRAAREGEPVPIESVLDAKGVRIVGYHDWLAIDAAEAAHAASLGRGERVKLVGWDGLYAAIDG